MHGFHCVQSPTGQILSMYGQGMDLALGFYEALLKSRSLEIINTILTFIIAGRTGPGDSGLVHKMLFDEDGPVAYHSAVHDGFGYLMTFHSQGPGYDYLGAWTLFGAKTSMSGQISGIKFWRETLKETTVIDEKEL